VTPLYPQKLALTSPTSGGRSVGIVRSRTKAMEFSFYIKYSFRTLEMTNLIELLQFACNRAGDCELTIKSDCELKKLSISRHNAHLYTTPNHFCSLEFLVDRLTKM
jgi:hypothetical protein